MLSHFYPRKQTALVAGPGQREPGLAALETQARAAMETASSPGTRVCSASWR